MTYDTRYVILCFSFPSVNDRMYWDTSSQNKVHDVTNMTFTNKQFLMLDLTSEHLSYLKRMDVNLRTKILRWQIMDQSLPK